MGVWGDDRIDTQAISAAEVVPVECASLLDCPERLDLHSSLLEAIGDGILAHTLEGHIVYVNAAACEIYGICEADFGQVGAWEWLPRHARDALPERLAQIQELGTVAFPSFGQPHDDGSPTFTEVHAHRCATVAYGDIIVSVVHDVTERVLAEKAIRHMAFHDTLTGLPNRQLLLERMQQALSNSDRHGDLVGVVFIDLDDFKPVNDTLGHAMGDEVLKIVSARLKSCMRESDTVARVGGDEFVALFPRLECADDLANIAASIAGCIDVPIQVNGHQVTVTASVGLAVYAEGEATDELIDRADRAMYRAKQDGLSGWDEYRVEQLAAHH